MEIHWDQERQVSRYYAEDESFRVEVHHWTNGRMEMYNKYVYLYPSHPLFAKVRPSVGPDGTFQYIGIAPSFVEFFNYHDVTHYDEIFDVSGNFVCQEFGDDYGHNAYDGLDDVGEDGANVYQDAQRLIDYLEKVIHTV